MMIRIEIHSTSAMIRAQEPLTVGLRGAKAWFTFGEDWTGLIKTAVFRQGDRTVTVVDIGEKVVIPWEVLTEPNVPVQIGVYGMDSTGSVAIPTVWAETEPVCPGADPDADPSTEPSLELWEQIQRKMGSLESLQTDDRSSLTAAINEANRHRLLVTVYTNKEGGYYADLDPYDIQMWLDKGRPVACYWHEQDMMLHLISFQGQTYCFTAVDGFREYQVSIREEDIQCRVTELAEKSKIPGKVSQLQNDAGYLTQAPVTSVNGQTGDVMLPEPVTVTVTQEQDGSFTADRYCTDLLEAYNNGHRISCRYGNRVLPLQLATKVQMIFGDAFAGQLHCVTIGTKTVAVTATPLNRIQTVNGIEPDEQGDVQIGIDGLSSEEKKLMLELFQNAAYIHDSMGATLAQLRALWSDGVISIYGITCHLTGVTTSNEAQGIEAGKDYSATLTPEEGYKITSVTVTMGGVDVSECYENGTVYIPVVLGDIEITAVASEIPVPDNALLYWDYTMGDILEHGFVKNDQSPAAATYSITDEGLMMVNNSESASLAFMSDEAFDHSKVEIVYVIKPVEILGGSSLWSGIVVMNSPRFFTLSTTHVAAIQGSSTGTKYVLPELGVEYTIRITGGSVYVNDVFAGAATDMGTKKTVIGINGTMYLKSVSVTSLEA